MSAVVMLLALTASSAFASSFGSDPIKSLDGAWHDEDYKVDIEIRDGVVTVTKVETEHRSVTHQKLAPGVVLGRLTGATPDGDRLIRFSGECRIMMRGEWVLQPCSQFGASALASKSAKGKEFFTFHIGTTQYFREADLGGPLGDRD